MFFEYNGVLLSVIDLTMFSRVNVYTPDNASLLYTRFTLGVSAEYAPGGAPRMNSVTRLSPDTIARLTGASVASSYSPDPRGKDPNALPAVGMEHDEAGTGPVPIGVQYAGPQTDAELYQRLMIPRKKLVLWAWDRKAGSLIKWVESPRDGMSVDATTGPLPLSCDVVSVAGEPNSTAVHFQIQTDITPCATGAERFVLAHRWTMSHSYDADYYLTRTTRGEITFHAGVRDLIATNPDSVRNQFILPIPLGFRRYIREVTQSPDGCVISYVIDDTDPTVCFSPGDSGATQMSIVETSQYTSPLVDIAELGNRFIPSWIRGGDPGVTNSPGMGPGATANEAGRKLGFFR